MQDAERKLCREVFNLATRDESPAHRARQCYTGACRPIGCSDRFVFHFVNTSDFRRGLAVPPETNPLRYACISSFIEARARIVLSP